MSLFVAPVAAQQSDVRGRVIAAGQPVADVEVRLGARATMTSADGRFALAALPHGSHRLHLRAIGYSPLERTVELPADSLLGDLTLTAFDVSLGDLVVTGTLAEVRLEDSPVKVELVTRRSLERNLSTTLMESVRAIPGLREQVDCGVCYTNSISINGMDGPYTAVLFDGVPVLGALATVYALNSLNPALLEQVEIIKGPASTLYGSEAMGGVVNVISRDPRTAPAWSINTSATSHGQLSADAMVRPLIGGGRLLAAASASWNDRFVDANRDGFSDLPLATRVSGFLKWSDGTVSARKADVMARYWHEDRFGGVEGWTPMHRGSGSVYGEYISTRRWEVIGGFRPTPLGVPLRIDVAVSGHHQDSWYGVTAYRAKQRTGFVQAAWAPGAREGALRPLVGVTWRRQWYDDNTPATLVSEDRVIPGALAELEVPLGSRLTVLGGSRVDHHQSHGAIVSPRLALKLDADEWTTFRLNLASGFRVVHLFTEDHAALSGSREVIIAEALEPERSATVTASMRTMIGIGSLPIYVDADLFHTRFGNRIIPDYAQPRRIIYRNLQGSATTRGLSLAVSADPGGMPFGFRAGSTFQRVSRTDRGRTSDVEFAPRFKGDFGVTWNVSEAVGIDWTGSLTGPMALPALAGKTDRSPWFTEQHLQATVELAPSRYLTVAIKNLFDTRQESPIVAPHDPFGPEFDTYRVWGPVQGRRLLVAMQWNAQYGREGAPEDVAVD